MSTADSVAGPHVVWSVNEALAATAHELRLPLSHIKGFVTSLRRTDVEWNEEARSEFLAEIDLETDRLAQLNQSQAGIRRVIAVGSCCGEQVARSWDGRHAGCTETMEVGPECDPAAGVSRPDAARAGALARAVAAG